MYTRYFVNQTTSVLIFNNKAVVVTASQYTAYVEKELYETQKTTFFLFKIKCLDEDLKLISMACPIKEIILIVQAVALFFFLTIWITRCVMTTIMVFKEMHLMTRTVEYRDLVFKTRKGVFHNRINYQ